MNNDYLSYFKRNKLLVISIFIIILVLPLTILLVKQAQDLRSSAAAPDKLETEGGVLSGAVTKLSDSLASGGQYVRFGTGFSPTAQPTSPPSGSFPPSSSLGYQPFPNTPMPGYLETIKDPTYGTEIIRVSSEAYVRHAYSSKAAWNSDMSLIALISKPGSRELHDGRTFEKLRDEDSYGDAFIWSNVDPNLGWAGDGGVGIIRYRVDRSGTSFLRTDKLTKYSDIGFGEGQGSQSNDDKWMCISWKKSNNDYGIAVLNMTTNPVSVAYERKMGTSGNSLISMIDNTGMSQTGNWCEVTFVNSTQGTGTGVTQGMWIYPRDLSTATRSQATVQSEHFGWARSADGTDRFVYRAGGNDVSTPGSYMYDPNTRKETMLVAGLSSFVHYSGRNINRPGWVTISSYNIGSTGQGYGQIFAINLDNPSEVQVYAHTYHTKSLGYKSEVQASTSPDGTKVIWASEWGGNNVYSFVAGMNVK